MSFEKAKDTWDMAGFNSLISRGLTFVNTIRVKFHICAGEEESSKL